MFRNFVFQLANGDEYTITIHEEEDAKACLREKLGVKRLPKGVKCLKNIKVELIDLEKDELKRFIKSENERKTRISNYIATGNVSGDGWESVLQMIQNEIARAESVLKNK